ncbi:hypothetical protein COL922a_001744 [Colletotrichum nupharicola]|nr:hypothetical protein COL922a_001744 [Colletotrichum nupharicola]
MAGRTIVDTETIYTSRVFKFIVGPENTTFHVHEKLFAPHSKGLTRMLNNGMRESQEGVVVLDDVDKTTFTSFLDYATYGNYRFQRTIPSENIQSTLSDDDLTPEKRCDSLQDHLIHYDHRPDIIERKPYLKYMELFVKSGDQHGLYAPPTYLSEPDELGFDVDLDLKLSNKEFGEVCQHHVKLYAFADKWDISELRQLCPHKIHNCLTRVKLCDSGYHLLFALIDDAYKSTMPGDLLRKLFTQMCVSDISLIRGMSGFPRLVCRLPEIGLDMILEEPKYWEDKPKALADVNSKFPPRPFIGDHDQKRS